MAGGAGCVLGGGQEAGHPPERPLSPQKEYFQDDLYPPTRVWWEPALEAGAWLEGKDGQQRRVSLRPADMVPGGCRGWAALRDGWGGFSQWRKALPPHGDTALTVSEAPKEAPARKFVPASVYLEEKTDEQKKEEVGSGTTTLRQGRG